MLSFSRRLRFRIQGPAGGTSLAVAGADSNAKVLVAGVCALRIRRRFHFIAAETFHNAFPLSGSTPTGSPSPALWRSYNNFGAPTVAHDGVKSAVGKSAHAYAHARGKPYACSENSGQAFHIVCARMSVFTAIFTDNDVTMGGCGRVKLTSRRRSCSSFTTGRGRHFNNAASGHRKYRNCISRFACSAFVNFDGSGRVAADNLIPMLSIALRTASSVARNSASIGSGLPFSFI